MGLLEQARHELIHLCEDRKLGGTRHLEVTPLSPDEAIGARASSDFAVKKGKERVIEATFEGARGQAFTDSPSRWAGTLSEAMSVDLAEVRSRAIFVAAMNAVMRFLGAATGTMHCLDEDPSLCGPEIAGRLEARFGRKKFGLIGLQPAVLRGLAQHFGAEAVRVIDLNPDNIGKSISGVEVRDGETELPRLIEWSDVGLATGSSIVNGSADEIVRGFREAGKPLLFYGNTISGAAALLGLERICPFGR
jgi:hypothetical protein